MGNDGRNITEEERMIADELLSHSDLYEWITGGKAVMLQDKLNNLTPSVLEYVISRNPDLVIFVNCKTTEIKKLAITYSGGKLLTVLERGYPGDEELAIATIMVCPLPTYDYKKRPEYVLKLNNTLWGMIVFV